MEVLHSNLTPLPHLLHRYCDQLTNLGTLGSYWRSDAPGRLGMPGKWDRNSNRGIDCLQDTGWGHDSSIRDGWLHVCTFLPIRNCIKSRKTLTAEITSRSRKNHSFFNFHWIATNDTPKWPQCSLQTCPIIHFLLSQLGFSWTEP